MALVEGEWAVPSPGGPGRRAGGRIEATGAVLFATLELPRPLLVRTVGTWPSAIAPSTPSGRGGIGAGAGRLLSWLLGR